MPGAFNASPRCLIICSLLALLHPIFGQSRQPVDLLLSHGTVVTMDAQRRILQDGTVAVSGGELVAIGPSQQLLNAYDAAKVVDARGALLLPGFINAHTHMAMSMFRGLAEDLPL